MQQLKVLECDAVGFGRRIHQTHPEQWTEIAEVWPRQFADYPISVEVKVKNLIWGRIWAEKTTEEGHDS